MSNNDRIINEKFASFASAKETYDWLQAEHHYGRQQSAVICSMAHEDFILAGIRLVRAFFKHGNLGELESNVELGIIPQSIFRKALRKA